MVALVGYICMVGCDGVRVVYFGVMWCGIGVVFWSETWVCAGSVTRRVELMRGVSNRSWTKSGL